MTHPSGLPDAIDRSVGTTSQQSVTFYGRRPILQGGELNELQTIARERHRRLGRLIAQDGDRVEGGEAIVGETSVTLTSGKIYVDGDVLPVVERTIASVPMTGRVEIGVRLVRSWVTHEDDATLLGQVPGSLAEGEPGAAREVSTISWALSSDAGDGDFVQVYVLQNGTIVDQTPPPSLSGVNQAIAKYDFSAHGHYIVSGCRVTALGKTGDSQVFSIEQGEANVQGVKLTRYSALRHSEEEVWDVKAVPGETHSYVAGASYTFASDFAPIDEISTILLTKQKTVSVTRGAVANGADGLPDSSVVQIVSVVQGATTFTATTDYIRTGNSVDWAPAGTEPAGGSSYNVTYRYRASVTADAFTDTTITVSGGIDGGDIIVAYTWKVPRVDIICLDNTGLPVYVTGVSSATNTLAPAAPQALLKLAEIQNTWSGNPVVVNNGVYNYTFGHIDKVARSLEDIIRLVMIERSKASIDARDPVAKRNMFVDPLIDDTYRDAGEVQTASVADGIMELAITPTLYYCDLTSAVMLDYTEEVVISQELATACVKINEYMNFAPLPAAMQLDPPVDFWTVSTTEWASPATVEFYSGDRSDNGPLESVTQSTANLGTRTEQATFLREISVTAKIKGFGAGENLATLVFDGINVKPTGTQTANSSGDLDVTFTIPAQVSSGSKLVIAIGAGESYATALFTGEGTVIVTTMQVVTTIQRWTIAPVAEITVTDITNNVFVTTSSSNSSSNNGENQEYDPPDPQAQTFTPRATRQMVGVDFKLCAIGDEDNDLLVHQVGMDNGYPTRGIVAEASVDMAGAVAGWIEARYNFPVLTQSDREHAFVIKSDDGYHAISVANLGDFDTIAQKYVTAHPYPVGVRLSSVNARTWTAHQNSSLAFRLVAAKFSPLSKTVDLGSFALIDCSDLQVRATVDLPSGDCSVVFEIERPGGEVFRLLPYQTLSLSEKITETVEVRAILAGSETLSPVLYAPVQLLAGEIAETGTYVTRAFTFGSAIRLTAYYKAFLPSGASVTVEYDKADDTWHTLTLDSTEALAYPNWVEPKHEVSGITAVEGRLRFTLTGGPAARIKLGDLGAAVF